MVDGKSRITLALPVIGRGVQSHFANGQFVSAERNEMRAGSSTSGQQRLLSFALRIS
jgi:hypothetical protein